MIININENKLKFGALLGFKISRLEFLWDSIFPEVKKHFSSSLNEIISMLPSNLQPKTSSYEDFFYSIFYYYLQEDESVFSAILIGSCIQRCTLYGSTKSETSNKVILKLAKSSLASISNDIVTNKEELFLYILSNKENFANNFIEQVDIMIKHFTGHDSNREIDNSKYVFISYSSIDYQKIKKLNSYLNMNNINCWMAPDSIPGGSNYAECIPNAIKNCSVFLLILSENSQRTSKWVTKELDSAINFDRAIIPFHIDNSPLETSFSFRLTNVQEINAYRQTQKAYNQLIARIKNLLDY